MGAAAALALVLLIIVRSCGYETGPVFRYGFYYLLHVALPGLVALHAIQRRPVSLTAAIALGLPTGYAIEVFAFLGLAALGAREAVPLLPLLWVAAGVFLAARRREWPLRCHWTMRHAGLALALCVLFLGTVVSATSQMFAESPLVAGLPQRPIFHDWIYLVSRAASIKHHWPFEDPSLAGSPLQYHYFMLVHAASASLVTKLEVTQVLLRFVMVPFGAILVVQAYALGRLVSRRAWAGVLAALMTVAISEVSFSTQYSPPVFLGLFTRWLYVSPTFYFGMIYFGALLLAVAIATGRGRPDWRHVVWLAGLAAAGTGAKGTMTPVLLLALAGWGAWTWVRERRFPARLTVIGLALGAGFGVVYFAIMSSWGTGQASFEPFRILQLTGFWKTQAAVVERSVAAWVPTSWAAPVVLVVCGAVVFAGTAGVRLLALAQLVRGQAGAAPWLGCVMFAAAGMGLMIHLHVYSELYLFLLIPLPMAVLTAAFVVGIFRTLRAGATPGAVRLRGIAFGGVAALGFTLLLLVQCGAWMMRHQTGLAEWLKQSPHMTTRDGMDTLVDAMLWIRRNTEPRAILVANAFTTKHLQQGRGDLVDHTTAGVHFYYSALSERRLFVEGPTYLQNAARVTRRLQRAGEIFYGARVPSTMLPGAAPGYAIIDRSLNDGARIVLPEQHRVYANARFEIYQLPRKASTPPAEEIIATLYED